MSGELKIGWGCNSPGSELQAALGDHVLKGVAAMFTRGMTTEANELL